MKYTVSAMAVILAIMAWLYVAPGESGSLEPSIVARDSAQEESAKEAPAQEEGTLTSQPSRISGERRQHTGPELVEGALDDRRPGPESSNMDRSGLTRAEKIAAVKRMQQAFSQAIESGDAGRVDETAYALTRISAVNILREQQRVQYTHDVDDGSSRGFFGLTDDPESETVVAADNGKFIVRHEEFPVFALAQERYRRRMRGEDDPSPLSSHDVLLINHFAEDALVLLGSN